MKTFLILSIILLGSIQSSKEPPEEVLNAFKQKFPSATNIKWIEEENKTNIRSDINGKIREYVQDDPNTWKACFKLKGNNTKATFSIDGHWLRSEMEIDGSELRQEIRSAAERDHPGCKVISAIIIEFVGGGTFYKVKVKLGNDFFWSEYDWNGWPIPRISFLPKLKNSTALNTDGCINKFVTVFANRSCTE